MARKRSEIQRADMGCDRMDRGVSAMRRGSTGTTIGYEVTDGLALGFCSSMRPSRCPSHLVVGA